MNLWHFLRYGDFAHDWQLARNDQAQLVRRCVLCGRERVVLGQTLVLDGPAHHQQPDLGARRLKARVERKSNIREWRRSER